MLDRDPHVLSWSIQLACEEVAPAPSIQRRMAELLTGAESAVVRRYLASALQRLPVEARWQLLPSLVQHVADDIDPNLPFLYWYAAETLAESNPARSMDLVSQAGPRLLPLMARRVGAIGTPEAINTLVAALSDAATADKQSVYLRGIQEGLKGKRKADLPKGWPAAFAKLKDSPNAEVRSTALAVAVTFGDPVAFDLLRKTLADAKADTSARQAALTALVDARDQQLAPILHRLVGDPALRPAAVRGLAVFDDPKTPEVLLAEYARFTPAEKRDALNTLAARPAYARAMLDAIAQKKLPAADVPAEILRQLRGLNDKALDQQIAAVWGTVRETAADRKQVMAAWQKKLTAPYQGPPDLAHGRAVYAKVCQQCHTLYGVGGKVGPDITGANRSDLGYLLENIFDPSAVIPKEYAAT
jgi:mono/diheme cytochrome c family protein